MVYEIKIFSELNSTLKKDWQQLENNSLNYCFQTYDWFESWENIYRKNNKNFYFNVCVLRYKSEIIAIFPFEIEKKYGLKILKWAGDKQADFCSPILNKNFNFNKKDFLDLYDQTLKQIKEIDLVYLKKQPEYIDEIINHFVCFLKNYRDSKTYNILLPNKWEDYNKNVLKKEFYNQNSRKKRSLEKLGELKFRVIEDQNEKKTILDKLFTQKNIRLSSKGIQDILNDNDLKFYKEYENKILKNTETHLSYLSLNDELIAIHWGIIYKNRFYYLLLSMKEERFRKYSPGRLLISSLIEWSIEKRLKFFDFTFGDEIYKKSWSNRENLLFNYIHLNSFNGFYLFLLIKFKLFLKQIDKKNYLRKTFIAIRKLF